MKLVYPACSPGKKKSKNLLITAITDRLFSCKQIIPLFLCLLLFNTKSFAQAKTFVPASGAWNVAANWSPSGVPGATNLVFIPSGKTVTATAVAINILGLTVNNGASLTTSGTQTIAITTLVVGGTSGGSGAATLAFGGTGAVTLGSVSMPDNNVGATASISQTAASGAINITNNLTIGSSATYTISKATACSWGGVQVNNGGSLIWAGVAAKTVTIGTGDMLINTGGSITTNSTATNILTLTNNGDYTNYGTFTGVATSPGTGTITLATVGAALLKSASINDFAVLTSSGSLTQESGAGLVSSGLVTFNGGSSSTIVSIGAPTNTALTSLNALTVSGVSTSVLFNGATYAVAGTLTISNTSTVQVAGASTILNVNAVSFATTAGGTLHVSEGTMNVATIVTATTAGIAGNVKVDGGTLNVNSPATANTNAINLTATGSSLYISGQGVVNVLGGLTTTTSTSTTNVNLGSGTAITVPFTIKDSTFPAGSAQLNISGKFIMAGNGAYNQSGGTILVGTTSANTSAVTAMFGTAANNSFTMSDGTITVQNKNAATSGLDLNILSTTTAFSNGVTTFLGNAATATGTTGSWNVQGSTPNLTHDNAANNNLGINFSAALTIAGDLSFSGTGTITSANVTTTLRGMSAAYPGNLTVTGQGHISLTAGTFAFGSASGNQAYNNSNTTISDTVNAVTLNNTYNTTGGEILLNKTLAITGAITYTKGYFQTTTNSIVAQLGTQNSSLSPANATAVSYTDSIMRRFYIGNRTSSGLATAANKNATRFTLAKNGKSLPIYIDANVTATAATPVFIDAKTSFDANTAPAWEPTIIQNHYTKLNRDFKVDFSGTGTLNSFNIGIDTAAANFTAPAQVAAM